MKYNLAREGKRIVIFMMKAVLVLNTVICLAQPSKKYTMENLKSKKKAELLEIVLEILKEKQPSIVIDSDDFESSAWQNSKEIIVKFRRYIRFIPFGANPEKRFSYDININLITKEISPFDDLLKSEFYIETKKDKKAIAFIKKNFGDFSANFENTIYEGEEDYFIDIKNHYSYGKYVLNKKTAEQKTEIQASYEPMPKPKIMEDPDALTEIE